MCLQFLLLQLLKSPSSLLASILPILGSVNSAEGMNSKATGITNRISDTIFGRTSLSKMIFLSLSANWSFLFAL